MREKLASRLGFILLSAGCAIGLGNVWRFPYIVGQSGGAGFVLIYLFFLVSLGVPVLAMEFATGRAAQCSIIKLHQTLTPEQKAWRAHGICGLIGNICLMMFYTTVTGWMVLYFIQMLGGAFEMLPPEAISHTFKDMLDDPWKQGIATVSVCVGSAMICAIGLQKGLERVTKIMMIALLLLIAILAVHSVLLDKSGEGLRFFLTPNFARMREVGFLTLIVNSLGQAFFTLSLGIGAMSIFGSYIGRDRALFGEAFTVAALDTLVAIFAGLIIIPACFAYGVEPGQGPRLIFVTIPNIFNHMSGGRFWGVLFFAFMIFAALSTVLTVFETIIACIQDLMGWSRVRTCIVLAVMISLLSLPCVLGFNVWSKFTPLGKGTCILDLEDFIVSNLLLPIGSLAFALYCCHRYGWGWEKFLAEVNVGKGFRFPRWARLYCAYILPLIILIVFILGLIDRFI